MLKNTILFSLLALSLTGCVGLNTVSMTQVPAQRDNVITTTSSSWNFIGINFSNAFVDDAIDKLKGQCPTGKIEGVYPVIINIAPLTNLQMLLGLKEDEQHQQLSRLPQDI